MSPNDSVSVVVPCYNAAAWIIGSLSSVYAQNWEDLELLVIDDGSTDESVALVKQHFPQATVLQQTNRGVAAARNAGIEAARNKWVAFIDADDYWLPGKLRAQIDLLAAHPEARMAYAGWRVWASDDSVPSQDLLEPSLSSQTSTAKVDGPAGWIYPDLLLGCCVWTSTVLAQRELLNSLKGFDQTLKLGEDYDLWLRASRITPILRVQRALALYRQHPNSLTRQPPTQNYEATVVQRAITQWGYLSPDGRSVRKVDVDKSLARTWRNFSAANLVAGNPVEALCAARKALRADWYHLGTWRLMVSALTKSAWRAS